MLPAKNYNIVNFILSNLDCYFPWQFFVNRTRGKDFQGGKKKKEKLIKIDISRTTTSWNPWPWTFQRVHRPQQFVIIREEFEQACASKLFTTRSFHFFRSIRQKLESHRRISPIEVHTDFYSTSYLNITMNGTIISLEKCSNRSRRTESKVSIFPELFWSRSG